MAERNRYCLSDEEKTAIIFQLRKLLEGRPEISFAYLHGSFVENDTYHDIDVAVYLRDLPASVLHYELELEAQCAQVVSPGAVDIRILNGAPLSFRYNAVKQGFVLFVKNDDERTDFIEATLGRYFDFAPYRATYLKEALGIGV